MYGLKNGSSIATLSEELGYIIILRKSRVGLEKWIICLKTQGDRRRIKSFLVCQRRSWDSVSKCQNDKDQRIASGCMRWEVEGQDPEFQQANSAPGFTPIFP